MLLKVLLGLEWLGGGGGILERRKDVLVNLHLSPVTRNFSDCSFCIQLTWIFLSFVVRSSGGWMIFVSLG